jgi:hypothetical protein
MLVALTLASGVSARAEVAPDSKGSERAAPGVAFRLLLREYLEFRVGSQVTIRSNAGQVVITAMDSSNTVTDPESDSAPFRRRAVAWRPGPAQGPQGVTVVPERDRLGATNICLYIEGTAPSCGDLSEIAGQVTYVASNP